MAARNFSPVRALQKELIPIAGSFAPNGASAVDATARTGPGWSVARTSAGLFTITLTDKYVNLLSAVATVQLTTGADMVAQVGVVDLAARTIQIRTLVAAVATDISAAAGNRINFCFMLSNTGVGPVRG
jgi:DNA-binding MurR/RpiR family transcriptional regulator